MSLWRRLREALFPVAPPLPAPFSEQVMTYLAERNEGYPAGRTGQPSGKPATPRSAPAVERAEEWPHTRASQRLTPMW
jgi:hypothetical protein